MYNCCALRMLNETGDIPYEQPLIEIARWIKTTSFKSLFTKQMQCSYISTVLFSNNDFTKHVWIDCVQKKSIHL